MPITAFSSFTDGLDASQRSREHFVTNSDLEDDRRWVPYADAALIMFVVEAALIYLDKAVDGGVAAYEDGFTLLELTRKYYRGAGLDVRELDVLVR